MRAPSATPPVPLHSPVGLGHSQWLVGCLVLPPVQPPPGIGVPCVGGPDTFASTFGSPFGLDAIDDRLHRCFFVRFGFSPPTEPHHSPLSSSAHVVGGTPPGGVLSSGANCEERRQRTPRWRRTHTPKGGRIRPSRLYRTAAALMEAVLNCTEFRGRDEFGGSHSIRRGGLIDQSQSMNARISGSTRYPRRVAPDHIA